MVLIAKGVGFLVAIVTVFLGVTVMILAKMIISYSIRVIGVIGVLIIIGLVSFCTLKFKEASIKTMWVMLTRSCN